MDATPGFLGSDLKTFLPRQKAFHLAIENGQMKSNASEEFPRWYHDGDLNSEMINIDSHEFGIQEDYSPE